MAADQHIKQFNATDIEKYHKGLLSPKERHALEKAALDDPFLADAIEGYAVAGVNVSDDIQELKRRLEARTEDRKVIGIGATNRKFPIWRAAAAIILIGGAGLFTYQFAFTHREKEPIANVETVKEQQPAVTDSIGTITTMNNSIGSDTIRNNVARPAISEPVVGGTRTQTQHGATTQALPTDTVASATIKSNVAATPVDNLKDYKADDAVTRQNSAPKPATVINDKEVDDVAARKQTLKENESAKLAEIASNEEARSRRNANALAQQYKPNIFRGRVTDNFNNGIPFANVTNVQDNVGTYTDARGYFNLTSPDSILNVQTRALGFNSYNVQLRNTVADNKIIMQEDQSIPAQTLTNKKVNAERRAKGDANFTFEGEPEPEDSWEAYDSYLVNNINIPKEFKSSQPDASRVVEVSFEVNKNGEPVNFKIIKSLCSKCDQEAIRLIKEGPKWKRKAKKGRTTVAISF